MSIREASSIIVERDGEILLVRRNADLRFFGGFWAFPGGTVRPAEAATAAVPFRTAPERFVVAAIHELFEELGLELWRPTLGGDRDSLRRALLEADAGRNPESRVRLAALWETIDARVALVGERLEPVARLLTPEHHPIRYDTIFFRLALRGEAQGAEEPVVWPGELDDGAWDTPAGWMERWRRGEVRIAPPVIAILAAIERSDGRPPTSARCMAGEARQSVATAGRIRSGSAFDWSGLSALRGSGDGRLHTIFYNPAAQLFPLATETLPPATHTNAYLVGVDPAYLLDPGPADLQEQDRLLEALRAALEPTAGDGESPESAAPSTPHPLPARRLRAVILTHHHRDHIGAAARMREEFGVPIFAHAATAERLAGGLTVDRLLADGDRLPLGCSPDGKKGWVLEVLHTPGHAPGHLCFFERRYGSLFIGDMASALSSVVIRRKDGTMLDYLASLRRLAALPSELVLPGHGPVVTGGPALLEQQLRHRAEREAQMLAVLTPGGTALSAEEIARRVYTDVPSAVLPWAAENVMAVLEKLETEGRAVRVGGGWCLSPDAPPEATPLSTTPNVAPPARIPSSDRARKGASMKPKQRVAALREQMEHHQLDAYLVPSSDPHQSEYVPECWQRRTWVSGFTGSAGEVLVLRKHAGLWTDGRYFLQAEDELRGTGVQLFRSGQSGVPTLEEYLVRELPEGARVGVDPRTVSVDRAASLVRTLREAGIDLVFPEENLVDAARGEAISLPLGEVLALDAKYTGETVVSKLRRLRKEMKTQRAEVHVLSVLDSIAWLFNIRGRDVPYNPVTIAYAIVTMEKAFLFIDERKVPAAVRRALGAAVTLRPYEEFGDALRELAGENRRIWIDRKTATHWMADLLGETRRIERTSPVVLMKAAKNGVELDGMRRAHVRDGVAMVRFLHWLEKAVPAGGLTEISAADELARIRAEGDEFEGLAFRTISGYGEHGAIIHYTVTPRTNVPIYSEGIYLVDSGAQYRDGTTDITRTVLLGKKATKEQKDRFTRVLKGHIALTSARFPKGTLGIALDAFARAPFWAVDLDYNHGTGHGVGCFLNVHEGPRSIANRPDAGYALEPGNVFSNEPGYYKPGAYGMRIENLIVVTEAGISEDNGKPYYTFEDLTLCPIDTRLIDPNLMTPAERKWLDNYHARVKKTLSPLLEKDDREWLARACAPL